MFIEIAKGYSIPKEKVTSMRVFNKLDAVKNPNQYEQIAFTLEGQSEPAYSDRMASCDIIALKEKFN